ncbi:MAG: hypothetical protein NWR17_03855 [Candidatus Nanopelagicales bacterium]|jgi:hypothetical protein|nr:hypothetical protein [Candidatus Nanopelagicales bacterium]MDP4906384.1 hypothetical protein [Candidatus Nanopelagicales bacterium]MDP4974026.1 hypothetical protein [Candidatus Nanopelagicales bacterium]
MRPQAVVLIASVLAGGLLTAACVSTAASEPAPTAPSSAAPSVSASPEAPGPSPSPPDTTTQAKPTVAGMATDRFADAVLEQIAFESVDQLGDQLVMVAMSPLLRQLAASADITTNLKSKGGMVALVVSGSDATCTIRVTDAPRARGVVCR